MANGRIPSDRPARIVLAESEEDVVAAVHSARSLGLRISVRSGGHSWTGSHLREGCLLIDVSRLNDVAINTSAGTAVAGPGKNGAELAQELERQNLFFPTGHCLGVCLGGFLLQGGFGWNSRLLGPACASVSAIDVVTAEGEFLRAGPQQNSELFWAARGAGPGFFGVVTAFHLELAPHPKIQLVSSYRFDGEVLEELMSWAHDTGPQMPRSIEMMVFASRLAELDGEPSLELLAPVLADSEEEAIADLGIIESCPVISRALVTEDRVPTTMAALVGGSAVHYPTGMRYSVDNAWIGCDADAMMPHYRKILETLPDEPSHMMWMNWAPGEAERPDMAYSVEHQFYIGLYSVWADAERDRDFEDWPLERMREIEPLSSGIQLADENLNRRDGRFLSEENERRLGEVRRRFDPDETFVSYRLQPPSHFE